MRWATWQGATNCVGGPESGAVALLAWLRETYPRSASMGIYNCRTVRGGASKSLHGEGRAVDLDPDGSRGLDGSAAGRSIVARLGAEGQRLGVQSVIYDREIWSQVSPHGRPYGGVHPHHDHLHIELTRAAGANLTLATLRAVLGGSEEDDVYVVRFGQSDGRVRRAQRVIQAAGASAGMGDLLPRFGPDGDYGDETAEAVDALAARIGGDFPIEGKTGMDVLVLDYARNWLR